MTDILSFTEVFNPELKPLFLAGYPGPAESDRTERLTARQEFHAPDVEKAFAVLCAELLKMEFGKEIFTGNIPEKVRDGCVVSLLPDTPGGDCDYWNGRIAFAIRARQREKLQQICSQLLVTLPLVKWLSVNSTLQQKQVTFCSFTTESFSPVQNVNGAGLSGFGAEIIFKLRVCITPPAPEFA